jgi:hypothetical protein
LTGRLRDGIQPGAYAWLSPDMKVVYFTSDRNGNFDLFIATR